MSVKEERAGDLCSPFPSKASWVLSVDLEWAHPIDCSSFTLERTGYTRELRVNLLWGSSDKMTTLLWVTSFPGHSTRNALVEQGNSSATQRYMSACEKPISLVLAEEVLTRWRIQQRVIATYISEKLSSTSSLFSRFITWPAVHAMKLMYNDLFTGVDTPNFELLLATLERLSPLVVTVY